MDVPSASGIKQAGDIGLAPAGYRRERVLVNLKGARF